MAATIAKAFGGDKSRVKETHRLGSQSATGQANTWRTFTTCHVNADGSGYVQVIRDGKCIHGHNFEAEGEVVARPKWRTFADIARDTRAEA